MIYSSRVRKAEFEEQMEQVQEDLKQAHISYSMGLEWKKEGMA